MAKQEEKTKDKNTEPEIQKKSFFKDERVRFTAGVFTVFLAVYLTIAFISYLFTWQADQSFEWQNIFSGSETRVENWTGKIGASFSVQFMNHWFGISSFTIPFIIGLLGLRLLKVRPLPFRKTTFKLLIGTVLLSLVLGFIARTTGGFLGSGLGGAHGLFVSDWISALIGKVGTAFLLILFCITYTIYVQPDSIHWFNRLIGEILLLLKPKKVEEVEVEANTITVKKTIVVNENGQIIEKQDDDNIDIVSTPTETMNLQVDENSTTDEIDDFDDDGTEEVELTIEMEEEGVKPVHQIQAVIAPEGEGDVELTIESIQEAVANGSVIENQELYDPTLELSSYQRPPIELLEE